MNRVVRTVTLLLACFLSLPAQSGPERPSAVEPVELGKGHSGPALLTPQEKSIVLEWHGNHPGALQCVPAQSNWTKKVGRGETVPVDIYRQCRESTPGALIARLPPPPRGTELILLEGKLVRVRAATLEILDVFDLPRAATGGGDQPPKDR